MGKCYHGDSCKLDHSPIPENDTQRRQILQYLRDTVVIEDEKSDRFEKEELKKLGIETLRKPPSGIGLLKTPDYDGCILRSEIIKKNRMEIDRNTTSCYNTEFYSTTSLLEIDVRVPSLELKKTMKNRLSSVMKINPKFNLSNAGFKHLNEHVVLNWEPKSFEANVALNDSNLAKSIENGWIKFWYRDSRSICNNFNKTRKSPKLFSCSPGFSFKNLEQILKNLKHLLRNNEYLDMEHVLRRSVYDGTEEKLHEISKDSGFEQHTYCDPPQNPSVAAQHPYQLKNINQEHQEMTNDSLNLKKQPPGFHPHDLIFEDGVLQIPVNQITQFKIKDPRINASKTCQHILRKTKLQHWKGTLPEFYVRDEILQSFVRLRVADQIETMQNNLKKIASKETIENATRAIRTISKMENFKFSEVDQQFKNHQSGQDRFNGGVKNRIFDDKYMYKDLLDKKRRRTRDQY